MTSDARLLLVLIALLGAASAAAALAARRARGRRPRRVLGAIAAVLGLLGLLTAWARLVEPRWIVVTTTHVPWPGPPLRVVVLSDVHAGRTGTDVVERAVRLANAADPDVVLLAGDYITGYEATEAKLAILAALRPLHARRGVYAVLGNHDSEPFSQATPRAAVIAGALQAMGFTVLRNMAVEIAPGITLVGLDEVQSGNIDPATAFRGVPETGARIALTHDWHGLMRPRIGRFDLAVTGHTHGGQLCVPLVDYCPPAAASAPYVAGLYTWPRGGQLFVTRGIGESFVLARFACRPEVAVLELGR